MSVRPTPFAPAEGTAAIPTIPWSQLYDDPVESKDGWNFLQDKRTPWPVDGSNWLLLRTRNTPSIQSQFIDDRQLTTKRVDIYLDKVIRFREKLCVIVHLCGGQPARGRELLSIRHRNTLVEDSRSVHRGWDGHVCDQVPQGILRVERR